ncbi:molybdopterin molybdotransferase MoeA [Thermostilla marina]
MSPPETTLVSPDTALRLVLETLKPLTPREVPLLDAVGLIAAEPIAADRDFPAFPRSMMDGFAVRAEDAGKPVRIVGEVAAGSRFPRAIGPGEAVRIMTGAPCPPCADTVVEKERIADDTASIIVLPNQLVAGTHIAAVGSECRRGRVVLPSGGRLTPLAIASAASFGKTAVKVVPQPRVSVITTGSELVPWNQRPTGAQIRDSNAPMLAALMHEYGLRTVRIDHARDTTEALGAAVTRHADADVVLFTGGVSVGDYDLVPEVLQSLGAKVVFHKVRQKPGKPLLFAVGTGKVFFGLPGNPLAAHFCCHRYVRPAVMRLRGEPGPTDLVGKLNVPILPKPGRTHFVLAEAVWNDAQKEWRLTPTPGISSADIFSAVEANCYLEIPAGREKMLPNTIVRFSFLSHTWESTQSTTPEEPV